MLFAALYPTGNYAFTYNPLSRQAAHQNHLTSKISSWRSRIRVVFVFAPALDMKSRNKQCNLFLYLWFVVKFFYPNSIDRFHAASTALITVLRNAPSSRAAIPAIVVPPGEVTMSFNSPGCFPVS